LNRRKANITLFQRDLRITDHQPHFMVQQEDIPLLLVCFFELSVMAYAERNSKNFGLK